MQPNHSEANKFIGSLLTKTTDNIVKHVLQTFDPTIPSSSNITELCGNNITRDHLKQTIDFLESQYPDSKPELTISQNKRNKNGYAELIVNFIEKFTPVCCLRCDTFYQAYS